MYSLKINNNEFEIKIKQFRNFTLFYENNISNSDFTKIDVNSINRIEILKDNQAIKEYILHPIIENFEKLLNDMKNNDLYCNVDIYEELIPFKYIIKKIDNNLYYDSFSFLFNSSIEK
jgi:hypothetical protein